jgi:phage FluMu protein Com
MNNLIKLLQPKDYQSKIKLYCPKCEFSVNRFAQLEIKTYIRKIKIEEL